MDIIFGDLDMDGIETAQQLRDRFGIPAIYVTALGDQATFERAKLTLPLAYVMKPFDIKELAITIETSLEKHRLNVELEMVVSRLTAVLDAVGDAVMMTDSDGSITLLNRAAEELTGFSAADVVGTDWTDLLEPLNDAALRSRAGPWTGPTGSVDIRHAELHDRSGQGRIVRYNCTSIMDKKGDIKGVVFAVRA